VASCDLAHSYNSQAPCSTVADSTRPHSGLWLAFWLLASFVPRTRLANTHQARRSVMLLCCSQHCIAFHALRLPCIHSSWWHVSLYPSYQLDQLHTQESMQNPKLMKITFLLDLLKSPEVRGTICFEILLTRIGGGI